MMDDGRLKQELGAVLKNLRRFAYSLAGSVADGDDLLQQTVLRILEKGAPEDADIRKWSFRICRNIWIDELRARKVRQEWARENGPALQGSEDGDRNVTARITLAETEILMRKMPEEQRVLMALVVIEGYSYKEASSLLDIPIGTVMSRVSRARAFIVDHWQKPAEGSIQ